MISIDCSGLYGFLDEVLLRDISLKEMKRFSKVMDSYRNDEDNVLGWMDLDMLSEEALINSIEDKAKEIRENADVFVVIGVGGSINGSRSAIDALQQENTPEIIYIGNNLSSNYINTVLEKIRGKSVYANIIAKNFATLEPGIGFRIMRKFMLDNYGQEEMKKRIICTGTIGESLEELAKSQGFNFFSFPKNVGGRYSVLSPVGLLPIAVAGISIREIFDGAKGMRSYLEENMSPDNPVILYAVARNMLYKRGKDIEILSAFEPILDAFGKWWEQLFAESEGKDNRGIFPKYCTFSEELHSYGQYIQNGQRNLFETFINIVEENSHINIPVDNIEDGFKYIDNISLNYINKVAYESTLKAHISGGVPCMVINMPEVSPYYLGQIYYFFEIGCYLSSVILGVNPFDQLGVDAYKENMFNLLKK